MVYAHNLGFPRIGIKREMKKTVEAYWRGEISQQQLQQQAIELQLTNWKIQAEAGVDLIPVGDFSWYDHVLDMAVRVGAIPSRFKALNSNITDTMFCMARGQAPNGIETSACEMTKWFDTNYHYIVPEFTTNQSFELHHDDLFKSTKLALENNYRAKPVILGPLSFLWLGKCKGESFNKLLLLEKLLPVYAEIFEQLSSLGVEWVQVDEPILVLDLPPEWQQAFLTTYQQLNFFNLKCLLATYFGSLDDNLSLTCQLPVDGLHIDYCRAPDQLDSVLSQLPAEKILSVGIIDGRNIWCNDLNRSLTLLENIQSSLGDRLWVAPSCSLLHVPIDLDQENKLDVELKSWFAFAKQKVAEAAFLTRGLREGRESIGAELKKNEEVIISRKTSKRIHNPNVEKKAASVTERLMRRQHEHSIRKNKQTAQLNLPLFPTTTIGSFPQTSQIRCLRRDYKQGKIDDALYEEKIRQEIAEVIGIQVKLGLDVLVHGEPERNDMVEYFGELLDGIAITSNGWVQSYGSRCVKPPIIFGDVSRERPMTLRWIEYAQSLTTKSVKGMLTGPVTILAWSFVRDDQPRSQTAKQIALALRDEVQDLERSGVRVIQIDEPAFRECLPLRKAAWQGYLEWAVKCFRLASCGVKDETQIHTHMCYSEFNDIIEAIAALDADVITIESSRSEMEILKSFEKFAYPNDIGPGIYDIHSPRIPRVAEIEELAVRALQYIPIERLWINPDCGLKTRNWEETKEALSRMVDAAKHLRKAFSSEKTPTIDLELQPAST
ncbi:5-methyltetrahydropteroyltriglutamate--homocysteine methyltransferase [Coxiella burnetii]|uniref:5-methyltetrahydropteroyltriglutamate-- homocysteine S-methyltransferase n=1 Tax=Coxiella burnetii TaxID=777 RepID=UPI000C04CEE4|nr:5-methyltetrahydropteroyltriglutamate--homocysteine S-methyltransferase [Coxiella burnetii]ATN69984.1 5-methyltetrahydropteroyltriglutamate--homocysteine methyltransferase [Coxiella burnetii]